MRKLNLEPFDHELPHLRVRLSVSDQISARVGWCMLLVTGLSHHDNSLIQIKLYRIVIDNVTIRAHLAKA